MVINLIVLFTGDLYLRKVTQQRVDAVILQGCSELTFGVGVSRVLVAGTVASRLDPKLDEQGNVLQFPARAGGQTLLQSESNVYWTVHHCNS